MEELFPVEYAEYKKLVPLFFTSYISTLPSQEVRFSGTLYKKNREFRALIGAVIFWLILTAKLFLL